MKEEFSNIHFGAVGRPPIDWRAFDTGLGDANDEAGPVEYDVAEVLGFDPDEDSEEDSEVYSEEVINGWEEVPRDEEGKWTTKGAVYHGTPIKNLESILDNGLLVSKTTARDEWGSAIHAAGDKKTALNYGYHKATEKNQKQFAIITLVSPPGNKKTKLTFQHPVTKEKSYTYFWEKDIPANYIKRIDIYTITGRYQQKLVKTLRQVKNIIDEYFYAVVEITDNGCLLNDFKNDWREVERAPAGTSEGGQWVGENSVTTEKEALKAMRKYKNGLSDDELDAFAEYTGSDYYEINRSLRDGEETILIDRLDVIKTHLDKVLEDAPKFKGTTYRGIKFTSFASYDNFAKGISAGSVITDKSFLSTTLHKHVAGSFTENLFDEGHSVEIIIRGKSGVFLDGLSADEKEKEVLFRRKTKFKVVKMDEAFWGLNRGKAKNIKLLLELEEL